jgi:phosphoribosyl 1,2-cyclic phosphodiesterase
VEYSEILSNLFMNVVSSGSKGNSTIIWDECDALVVDFGISVKRFRQRFEELNIGEVPLSVLITHEHSDHSSGLGAASRKMKADIYLREKAKLKMGFDSAFTIRDELTIGNFFIRSVSVSHDAVDPVGYVIENRGRKISLFSDLGYFPMENIDLIRGSDILAIEANHDTNMLKTGPYPESLKKRIMSNYGHLSNDQCALALGELSEQKSQIILLHLSDENNTQEIAYLTIRDFLDNRNIKYKGIECARQLYGSSIFEV